MKPEEPKARDKEDSDNHERPVEDWPSLWIISCRMCHPFNEIGIGPRVTFSAGFEEALLRDCGFGIFWRQDIVKPVAIGTACDKDRVTQFLNLAVVAPIVGLGCNEKDLISLHHLPVGMAFLANLGMELLPK